MKFREIIQEEGDSAGTMAGDISHVSYPLFVRGSTRKQKRRNARAAVGQHTDNAPAYIGQGVFEAWVIKHRQTGEVLSTHQDKDSAYDELQGLANEREQYRIVQVQRAQPKDFKMGEAHVVDHNNVIYRLDTANPMDDTEVLVLGGAGRYTLQTLRLKARREAAQLAKELESEHGDAFRRNSENIKQLTNTLNTIVAAYNQLERIRQRGGSRSRGIRREHCESVKEGIAVLERVCQSRVEEKAPPGFDKKLYKELIDRYGQTSRAYATMWTIHNKTKGKK